MNISQYIQGLRRGNEANRIEFEAMRDPFIADALEGYSEPRKSYKRQINILRKTIIRKCRKTPNYVLIGGIAAGIAIIMGIGTYLFIIEPDEKEPVTKIVSSKPDSVAFEEEKLKVPEPSVKQEKENTANVTASPDTRSALPTAKIQESTIRSGEPLNNPEMNNTADKKEPVKPARIVEEPVKTRVLAGEMPSEIARATEVAIQATQTESKEEKPRIKGRVTDDNGNPVTGASVSVIGANKRTNTNSNGYFELEADNNSNLMIRFQGYEPVTLTGTTDRNMQISIKTIPVE